MRFRLPALLGILILLIFPLSTWSNRASGQSATVDIVQSKLDEAFVLVQQADLQGASPAQISALSNNLNLALAYEENATLFSGKNNTASYNYASKSVNVSAVTSLQAQSIASSARNQGLYSQIAGYSIALAAGFCSALFVLEFHRVSDFVRAKKLRRVRIG